MGWFSSNDKDSIKSEIRDLEREYDYLESEIRYAKNKWWDYRFDSDSEKRKEADYWDRLQNEYINKQYYVKEKIRDLEREL